MKRKLSQTLFFLILIITITLIPVVKFARGSLLVITVSTDKETYGVGEVITVTGNIYYGTPVSTLVGIEIADEQDHILTIRTLVSGPATEDSWQIEILNVTPCDQMGNPKNDFYKGELAYFKVEIQNNLKIEVEATVTLTLYYADGTSAIAGPIYEGPISPGYIWLIASIGIPSEAPTGLGTIYANLFTDMPKNNGYPLCPEKATNFTILGSGSPAQYVITTPPTEEGEFRLLFKTPKVDSFLGTYTVYASATYSDEQSSTNTNFNLILRGDVNYDGKVDMKDIILIIGKFGTSSSDPEWDPVYDLNYDEKVDIKDIVIAISNFANTAYYS